MVDINEKEYEKAIKIFEEDDFPSHMGFIEFRSGFPMKRRMSYSITQEEQIRKKNRVKQAIIEFLNKHPKSRNGEIFHHIHHKMITRVSVKMFNSYLDELVSEAQVEKTKGNEAGFKYPRYSVTSQTHREQLQLFTINQWTENVWIIIRELDAQAAKLSSGILAERMYFVFSIILGLLTKKEIMQEFYDRKSLTNQTSYRSSRKPGYLSGLARSSNLRYPTELDNKLDIGRQFLFEILDKLPAKKRKTVLDRMIGISERDYGKILAEEQAQRIVNWLEGKNMSFSTPNFWIGVPGWEEIQYDYDGKHKWKKGLPEAEVKKRQRDRQRK